MSSIYNNYYYEQTTTYWPFGTWASRPVETLWNGWQIYYYLRSRGFSVEAICGILGNAMSESTGLNSGQIENGGNIIRGGIGFIQWTNTRGTNKIYEVMGSLWYDGAYQAQVLADEIDPATADGTYYQNDSYPSYYLPNAQYMAYSGDDLEFITKTYFYCRERGTWNDVRTEYASDWYTILTGEEPPTPPTPTEPKKARFRKILYYYIDSQLHMEGKII